MQWRIYRWSHPSRSSYKWINWNWVDDWNFEGKVSGLINFELNKILINFCEQAKGNSGVQCDMQRKEANHVGHRFERRKTNLLWKSVRCWTLVSKWRNQNQQICALAKCGLVHVDSCLFDWLSDALLRPKEIVRFFLKVFQLSPFH